MAIPRMVTIQTEKIRPYSSFEVQTKDGLHYKLAQYGYLTMGGNAKNGSSYSGIVKDGFIYLYHAEKYRLKTKQTVKKTRGSSGWFTKKSEILQRGHWKVRVFKFDLARVVSAKQLARTFKITLKA